MSDIALQLGISKNAVSIALNNKPGVGDELRRKIIETASALNYGGFSANEANRSKCIAVVVPEYLHNDTFFYADIFWAVEREASKRGYLSITASVSREMEAGLALPMLPKEMHISGLLVIGVVSEEYLSRLYQLGYPIITVDITYHNVTVNSVGTANFEGAYTATRYLADSGHREIGFVGPIHTAQSVYERWCGFHQALQRLGLEDHAEYHITGARDHFELLDTPEVLEPYLNRIPCYPTAWFCAGDRIAVSLVQQLNKRQLSVPGDISVVGFDDISIAQMTSPPLTTVRVNRKLMGKLAVERLIALQSEPKRIYHVSLPGTLIVRESVRQLSSEE